MNNYFDSTDKFCPYMYSLPETPGTEPPLNAIRGERPTPRPGYHPVANATHTGWDYIEDHRQHMDSKGTKQGGTPYWRPVDGDDWQSPPRYTEELGPLPEGAVTERPEKPAPTLEEAKTDAVKKVDNATSAVILAGFDYETDFGTGVIETLHFSYDSFDQQNFADSANVATLAVSGTPGLPESVTWNAYRDWTVETGGELVRLTLTPATFLELYTAGALTHKATQMEIGGQRKVAVEAAESAEAVQVMLDQWGL